MSVVKKIISLEHIPAVIWGVPSSKVYLYVHGQGGNKEEAADFAEIIVAQLSRQKSKIFIMN